MICITPPCALHLNTNTFSSATTPSAPLLSPRELYLRVLEQEREDILEEEYARKEPVASTSSSSYFECSPVSESSSSPPATTPDTLPPSSSPTHTIWCLCGVSPTSTPHAATCDARGKQLDFARNVRQRQTRLEFLRRQDCARRLAARGRHDKSVSAYAIKRLPPPRARPSERVYAAITIQRAYRRCLVVRAALADLGSLHIRLSALRASFPKSHSNAPLSIPTLELNAAALGTLLSQHTALSQSLRTNAHAAAHPHVRRTARSLAEERRRTTDEPERQRQQAYCHLSTLDDGECKSEEEDVSPAQTSIHTALYTVVRATSQRMSGSLRKPISRAPSLDSVPEDLSEF